MGDADKLSEGEFMKILSAMHDCTEKLATLRLAFVAGLPEAKNALAAYEQAHNHMEEAILTARERHAAECAKDGKELNYGL